MGMACRDVACRVRMGCVLQVACGRTADVETHGRASLRWDGPKRMIHPLNFITNNIYL